LLIKYGKISHIISTKNVIFSTFLAQYCSLVAFKVDLAYRPQPFTSEANRMEFLFGLYEKYTADLFTKAKSKKRRKHV
jgi:hypothetical protein